MTRRRKTIAEAAKGVLHGKTAELSRVIDEIVDEIMADMEKRADEYARKNADPDPEAGYDHGWGTYYRHVPDEDLPQMTTTVGEAAKQILDGKMTPYLKAAELQVRLMAAELKKEIEEKTDRGK